VNKKKKSAAGGPKGVAGWMASYADMVTVLMAFFILLFAMSQIDEDLFERFIISFNPARAEDFRVLPGGGGLLVDQESGILPNIEEPPPAGAEGDDGGVGDVDPEFWGGQEHQGDAIGDMMNTFMTYMADILQLSDLEDGVLPDGIEVGENYFRINIDEFGGVSFAPGQARLTPAAIATLDYFGPMLRGFTERNQGIIVEGHTDNVPISSAVFPTNWTLSSVRASTVVEYLVANFDIPVYMIAGLGRGEYFPIADNETVEGRAQNRRVEIKIFTQEFTTGGAVGRWFSIPGTY